MKMLINFDRLGTPLSVDLGELIKIIKDPNFSAETFPKEPTQLSFLARRLVNFLGLSPDKITEDILLRYSKLSTNENYISITLAKPEKIEQRIIAPLVSAKKLACLEEFLASIALSGLVGEMLAILIWEFNQDSIKKISNTISDKLLFGKEFNWLGQQRRIDVLYSLGYIELEEKKMFDRIAKLRNSVLHNFTDNLTREDLEKNAIDCYLNSSLLLKKVFKLEVHNADSIKMDPKLENYLARLQK